MAAEVHDRVGRGQGEKRRHYGRAFDLRVALLHVVTELGAQPDRLGAARAATPDSTGAPFGAAAVQAMRSLPGFAPTSSRYGAAGGGATYGSPAPGPHVASSSAALSRTVRLTACSVEQTADALADERRKGVAAACRLESHQAAARRGRANGAEAVGGVRDRQHARCDRGCRAAARAARDAREVPRIPRRTVELRLARQRQTELAGVGAPEDDEARALQAASRARCRRRPAACPRRTASPASSGRRPAAR